MTAANDAAQVVAAVQPRDWLIVAPLVIPILAGAALVALRSALAIQAWIAVLALGLMAAADAALLARVMSEGPAVMTMGRWLPPFGISFAVDALGAGFALVSTMVALVCAAYAARGNDSPAVRYGFYPFLLLMMAGVSGAFLTGDVFNLYVWFEVFVIASIGLLVLGSTAAQLDGGLKYAVLNLIGTTLFLIATGYLYGVLGALNMADLALKVRSSPSSAPLMTIATLYLAAFGMKAAAFPLNAWLPASYHTPKPAISALLAGLLTKVGIYALLRTLVIIFPIERAELADLITWAAALTMILGALGALAQSDIRRMFGFVVLSGVGVMLAGLALGTRDALAGAIFYALVSMIGMSALYLLAGTVRDLAGNASLHKAGGLFARSPLLAATAFGLFLSAAGLPPMAGLWPKVILVQAAIGAGAGWLAASILVSSALLTIALFRILLLAFWRDRQPFAAQGSARASVVDMTCLALLSAVLLAAGLAPEPIVRYAEKAAAGLTEPAAYLKAVIPGARLP